jgi:hypothetical protein
MSGIVGKARHAFGPGSSGWAGRRDLAALAGMAVGSAADFSRLGPLGIVEICGDPAAGLFARIGAHGFGYAGMLAGIALVALADLRSRPAAGGESAWRAAFHAFAMCAGMAAADVVVPGLPVRLTPALSLLMMTLGMACGTLVARSLAGGGAERVCEAAGAARGS